MVAEKIARCSILDPRDFSLFVFAKCSATPFSIGFRVLPGYFLWVEAFQVSVVRSRYDFSKSQNAKDRGFIGQGIPI